MLLPFKLQNLKFSFFAILAASSIVGCTPSVKRLVTRNVAAISNASPTPTPTVSALTLADLEGIFESNCVAGTGESYAYNLKIESSLSYIAIKHFVPSTTCTGNYSIMNSKGDPISNYEVTAGLAALNISGLPDGFQIAENTAVSNSNVTYTPIYITDEDNFQLLLGMDIDSVNFGASLSDWTLGSADMLGFYLDPTGFVSGGASNLALHRVKTLYTLDGTWEAPCTDMGSSNYGILREVFSGTTAQVSIDFFGADTTCSGTPVSNYVVTNNAVLADVSITDVPNNFRTITSTDLDNGNTQVKGAYYQDNPDEFYSFTTDPANTTGSTWAQWLASNPTLASFAGAPTTPVPGVVWHFTKVYSPVLDMTNGTVSALSDFFMTYNFTPNSNYELVYGKAGNGKGSLISIKDNIVHIDENLELDTKFGRGGVVAFPSPYPSSSGYSTSKIHRIALSSSGHIIYPTLGSNGDVTVNFYTSKGTPALVNAFDTDGSHEYPMPHPSKTPGQIVPLDSGDGFIFWDFSYDGGLGDAVSRFIKGGLAAAFDLTYDTDGVAEVPLWQSPVNNFGVISSPSNMVFTKFGWISASTGAIDPINASFWAVAQQAWGFDGKIAYGINVQTGINNSNTLQIVKAASDGNLDATFGTAGQSDIPLETATYLLNFSSYDSNFYHLANGKSVLITSGSALKKADCNFDYSVCGSNIYNVFALEISATGTLLNTHIYSAETDASYHLFSASSGNDIILCYGNNVSYSGNSAYDSVDCAVHTY